MNECEMGTFAASLSQIAPHAINDLDLLPYRPVQCQSAETYERTLAS